VARVRKSELAVIVDVDAATSRLLGWPREDLVGQASIDFIHPDDQAAAVESWMQMLTSRGPGRAVNLRHKHRDGSWVWVSMTNHNQLDDPDSNCVLAEMTPLRTELRSPDQSRPYPALASETDSSAKQPLRLHEAIRAREQLLHRLAEALPLGVIQLDVAGRIVYSNTMFHTIIGPSRVSDIFEQLTVVFDEDRGMVEEALEGILTGGLDSDIEVRLKPKDGDTPSDARRCTISLRALTSEQGAVTGGVVCIADITESVRVRDELRIRATIDQVTQCHNRASTMDALENALATAPPSRPPAVVYIDLDHFKDVNDRWGHAAGDELLAVVARRLLRSVRDEDLVGRVGGDEFLVICPGISVEEEAMSVALRAAESLHRNVRLKGARVSCHASVGVAWAIGTNIDADSLVSRADGAMYVAKRAGNGLPVMSPAPGDSY
jgi:diguanylate cyclase (GGDEF)-like protein/PAS domain S-box-containing protein